MQTKSDAVLREIEEQSEKTFLPIVGPVKGKLLEQLIKDYKPKRVLEIGVLVGYSAIIMTKSLERGKIIGLEIKPDIAEQARKNIARAGATDKIDIIVGDATKTIKKLEGKFDFVFIDAEKNEYITYIRLLDSKMKKNMIVVADNAKIFAKEMKSYLDYVRNSGLYRSKFHDFGFDGVEVSIRL